MVAQDTLLPLAAEFLAQDPVPMFIDGQWTTADDGATFDTLDPGDGSRLATVAEGKAADIDKAVVAARNAFESAAWRKLTVKERAALMHRLADLVETHQDVLTQIESLDVGKPLAQAAGFDIPNVAQTLRWYADFAVHAPLSEPIAAAHFDARQIRVPYGVAAFVLPWNFPLLLVGWNISPALAAGNTVVIKPAENTPLSTLYFCKLVQEAGFPPGAVNVVSGFGETAGVALAEHTGINRMGFTGSPEVGRLIASACGRNLVPVKCELGGKGAAVVFDDVDLHDVAEKLTSAVTLNTGQVCCTATRWMLHEKLWDKFISTAGELLKDVTIGHALAADTQMGPLVSETQRERVLGYLERGRKQGAEALLKGGAAKVADCPGGFYVSPAMLTGDPANVCAQEEIFGPVAFAMKFRDEAEAVELVNGCPYGLANSVWSADLGRAARVAEAMVAGNSWINGHNLFPHGVPYAGCNLSGIGGGVLGPDTLFDYLRAQSIVRPLD
ncbi:MAG: aldehyde dehydrogenase family protein [Planctomycetota bacterium]